MHDMEISIRELVVMGVELELITEGERLGPEIDGSNPCRR